MIDDLPEVILCGWCGGEFTSLEQCNAHTARHKLRGDPMLTGKQARELLAKRHAAARLADEQAAS